MFQELCDGKESDTFVIALAVWSDEADLPSGSRHIMRLTIANILTSSRFKDKSIRYARARFLPFIESVFDVGWPRCCRRF